MSDTVAIPSAPPQTSEHKRDRLNLAVRLARDLCMLGVGLIGLVVTPPSITTFSDRSSLVAFAWAAMFIVGALCSLFGVIRDRPLPEIVGCSFISMAFLVWAIAAVSAALIARYAGTPPAAPAVHPPTSILTTIQIALVFLSGVFAQFYRGFVIVGDSEGRSEDRS